MSNPPIPEFMKQKFRKEPHKFWNSFYRRNTTNFFKDRHWTQREFPELAATEQLQLLEVGCGVGNFVFPLVKENPNIFAHLCDFAPFAIDLVKKNELYDPQRMNAFVCDVATQNLIDGAGTLVDIVSCLFVLSALQPESIPIAFQNIRKVLKQDYADQDLAMLRFHPTRRLDENFYVRQDGTFSYFFRKEELESMARDAGFEVVECEYVERSVVNRKQDVTMFRRFLQAKFKAI